MITSRSVPEELTRGVLGYLEVDWLYLSGVHRTVVAWFVADGRRHDDPEIIGVTWQVLYKLLAEKLVLVGQLTHDGFVVWDEQGLDAYERLHREVTAIGSLAAVHLGDVAWFELTQRGREVLKTGSH